MAKQTLDLVFLELQCICASIQTTLEAEGIRECRLRYGWGYIVQRKKFLKPLTELALGVPDTMQVDS